MYKYTAKSLVGTHNYILVNKAHICVVLINPYTSSYDRCYFYFVLLVSLVIMADQAQIDELEYQRLTKLVSSLTKLEGRRPKSVTKNRYDANSRQIGTQRVSGGYSLASVQRKTILPGFHSVRNYSAVLSSV